MTTRTDILPPRYRSPQAVGAGGMGEIYRAIDTELGRTVAVKVLAERYSQDEGIRGRFTREALAAARLSSDPHIVTIFDVGEWNGRPFIVMEYLAGGSVEERLRGRRPEIAQALVWLEQAAAALDAAHAAGVVHRDVKPGNLLLDRSGALHVADFGVASAAGTASLTMTGTILGTAGYLSPEQAAGERATAASDLYSLGVVAFELLTGGRPFEADSATAEASGHAELPVPAVSDALDPVFRRALAKDPRDRYGSAAELAGDLRRAVAGAAPPTLVAKARRGSPRRGRLLVLLALLVAGAAGAAAAAVLMDGGEKAAAPVTPRVVVKTVTGQGRTVQRTVTSAPTTAAATAAAIPSGDGHRLNDRGYSRLQAGDARGALPLLQGAVRSLAGVGPRDVYEGYANYNLGTALLRLGRCSEARPYLERARNLEPKRHEPKDALKQARRC